MEELDQQEKLFIAWAIGFAIGKLTATSDIITANSILRKLKS